jgi:hypothetical protein
MATVQKNTFIQNGMEGTGILENIKKAMELGRDISDIATGPVGTTLRNLLPSSDKNARPGFPGEKHALLKLPNGRIGVANYMGPGTQIEKRLARGDPPRTLSDKVAQAHDIRYSLATNQKDVRNADRKMVSKLKQIERTRGDSKFNTQLGMRMIQAKMLAEKTGLAKPGKIASFGGIKDSSKPGFMTKLDELEQEGFGLPGDMLKAKLQTKYSRKRKRGPKRTNGKGLALAGLGPDKLSKMLSSLTTSKILPALLKMLSGGSLKLAGQGMPQKKLKSLLHMRMLKALNNGSSKSKTLPDTKPYVLKGKGVKKVFKKLKPVAIATAKTLMPIIIKMALSKMRGGASFDELKKRVENPSILGRLNNKLAEGLFHMFKKILLKQMGVKQSGGSFASFFKGFKKGFMKVLGPALKVGKAIAPIVPLLL